VERNSQLERGGLDCPRKPFKSYLGNFERGFDRKISKREGGRGKDMGGRSSWCFALGVEGKGGFKTSRLKDLKEGEGTVGNSKGEVSGGYQMVDGGAVKELLSY